MKRRGLTLVEILVSVVLLALIMRGLVGLFLASKRSVQHTRSQLTAAELGRFYLDPLQLEVDQSQWHLNCVGAGNCTGMVQDQGLGKNYTINFTQENLPAGNMSKIKADITFME